MSLYNSTLSDLQNGQTFIEIFVDRYDVSAYGYIAAFNTELLLIEKFDGNSRADGVLVLRRDDISNLRWNGNDLRNRERLVIQDTRIADIHEMNIGSVESTLRSLNERFGNITVYMDGLDKNNCFIGEIQDLDSETLILNEFGTFATWDRRKLMIEIENITRIESEGTYEKNLMRIYK